MIRAFYRNPPREQTPTAFYPHGQPNAQGKGYNQVA